MKDIVLKKILHSSLQDKTGAYVKYNYQYVVLTYDGTVVKFRADYSLTSHIPWIDTMYYKEGLQNSYYYAIRGSRIMRKYVYDTQRKTKCRCLTDIIDVEFLTESQVFNYLL